MFGIPQEMYSIFSKQAKGIDQAVAGSLAQAIDINHVSGEGAVRLRPMARRATA
jgi:hypothetical protein